MNRIEERLTALKEEGKKHLLHIQQQGFRIMIQLRSLCLHREGRN
ncbi:MAG: hypothetical protein ACLS9K_00380 [Lachnospira eligens]